MPVNTALTPLSPLPRLAGDRYERLLGVMPVVVLMGARQTGKSTFVRDLATTPTTPDKRYVTLEDRELRDLAITDPAGFVAQSERLIIDEIQKAPDLFSAIKSLVDNERQNTPGRFVLTGSANMLLMKKVKETLAGRASYLTIWPMTRREQLGLGSAGIWSDLLSTPIAKWRDLVLSQSAPYEDWRELAKRGGYPRPAVHLRSEDARAEWFSAYINTYLERDILDIAAIENIPELRKLMRALCLRLGALVNQTQLGRDTGIPQSTVQRYLNLLETSYQLVRLEAYTASKVKRLIKTPKLYWSDSALAMHLAGEREPRGEHMENIVLHDLLAWRQTRVPNPEILYWRTTSGQEVDFVVEDGQQLLPIEVKITSHPSSGDLVNMRVFMEEYPDKAMGGVLLYTGEEVFWIAKNVLAVPWWRII